MKRFILTVDSEIYDFAETSSDPIDRFAQIVALVILLNPSENERTIRMYS